MTFPTQNVHSRLVPWLAWLPLAINLMVVPALVFLQVTVCAPASATLDSEWGWLPTAFSTIGFAVLCGLIVTRQPQNRIGRLCGAIAVLTLPFLGPASVLLPCDAQGLISLPGMPYLAPVLSFSAFAITLEFFLLPLWFPNGRFLSAGWRRFAIVFYGLLALFTLLLLVWPGNMFFYEATSGQPLDNPLGLPFQPSPGLTTLVQQCFYITMFGGILAANFSLFARWRRSDDRTRQQIKVLAFFVVTIGSIFMLFQLAAFLLQPTFDLFHLWGAWLYGALVVLLWVGYPAAVGVSVLKYRLYDIDLVIRRTLVYGALTLSLGLVYFASVVVLQNLLESLTGQEQSPLVIVISTLLIAALFNPLRRRLQEAIDRRFYRRRYDAAQTLEAFAAGLRQEVDLEQISRSLLSAAAESMQPEHASLWLKPGADKIYAQAPDQ